MMTHEELQPTLDAHREWLTSGGARGKRADLTGFPAAQEMP